MRYVTKNGVAIVTTPSCFNPALVVGKTQGIIVDTGTKKGLGAVLKLLARYDGIVFRYLVLTHGHWDHIENLPSLLEKVSGGVIHHRFENIDIDLDCNCLCSDLSKLDELKELHIKVVDTPGHTAGSISLIIDDEFAIVGDAMGRGQALQPSIEKLMSLACKVYMPSHGKKLIE